MSNIDQNTIITLLEEVIPQMQSSDNAENTLLKFAAEKNLAPAVVERMCHAFNQLKTNCILDHAESMEKRGSSFSLIDGSDFVKKYTDFAKDIDVSKMEDSISKSKNLWGIPEENSYNSFKLASADLEESSDFNYISDYKKEEFDKLDSLISATHKKIATETSANKTFDYRDVIDAKRNIETVDEVMADIAFKQQAIVSKLAKDLSRDASKLASFKSAEEDALYISDDVTADKINNLISSISFKNKFVAENIKRASDKGKRRLIKQASELTSDIISYCKNIDKVEAALEVKDSFEKIARKLTDEELNSLLATGGMAPAFNPADYEDEPESSISNEEQPDTSASLFETFDKKVNDYNNSKNDYNNSKNDTKNSRNDTKSIKNNKSDSGRNEALTKAVAKSIEDINVGSAKALDRLLDFNKTLVKLDSNAQAKPHAKFTLAKTNIFDTISDLNFQKMMMTDPILSKLNPEEVDNVTEAYMTYKLQYPEIALQPSLLRSILRSSAQVEGGEDINTLKSLIDARKSLIDARSKESMLG